MREMDDVLDEYSHHTTDPKDAYGQLIVLAISRFGDLDWDDDIVEELSRRWNWSTAAVNAFLAIVREEPMDNAFNDRLRAIMAVRGFISQKSLAKAAGVSEPTMSRILNGKTPNKAVVNKLCELLRVDPAEIGF